MCLLGNVWRSAIVYSSVPIEECMEECGEKEQEVIIHHLRSEWSGGKLCISA